MSSEIIDESLHRIDLACTAARNDPKHAADHYDAALRATGDLQRALILEQLTIAPRKVLDR